LTAAYRQSSEQVEFLNSGVTPATALWQLLWDRSWIRILGAAVSASKAAEVVSFQTGHLSRYDWALLGQWSSAIAGGDRAEFCVCSDGNGDSPVDFDRVVLRIRNDAFRTYVIYRPTCYPRWVTVTPEAPEEGIVRETRSLREALNAIRPALPEVDCSVLQFRRPAS
jgi:hypothetical protein